MKLKFPFLSSFLLAIIKIILQKNVEPFQLIYKRPSKEKVILEEVESFEGEI